MDDPDWKIPSRLQPDADSFTFDLERALRAVVGVRVSVSPEAFTAQTLGTDRSGNGVLIGQNGLVLTIGYLITEAETVWLTSAEGGVVPGHVIAVDQASGFGLLQALGRLNLPTLELGDSSEVGPGVGGVFAASGGRHHAVKVSVVGRQPFAGYWEYMLEHPIFTNPAHPFWGGGGLIGPDGTLIGIGSLIVQHAAPDGRQVDLNMVVPVELLTPIMDDLLTRGKSSAPPRPWLGLYCGEGDGMVVVQNATKGGPADRADVRSGDRIVAVGDTEISDLTGLWRALWSTGDAGVVVKLTVARGHGMVELTVPTADRAGFLRGPRLH